MSYQLQVVLQTDKSNLPNRELRHWSRSYFANVSSTTTTTIPTLVIVCPFCCSPTSSLVCSSAEVLLCLVSSSELCIVASPHHVPLRHHVSACLSHSLPHTPLVSVHYAYPIPHSVSPAFLPSYKLYPPSIRVYTLCLPCSSLHSLFSCIILVNNNTLFETILRN